MPDEAVTLLACSECFSDQGLRLDAEQCGVENDAECQNCHSTDGKKLGHDELSGLAHRFFVWGSLLRLDYGAAPTIQFNDRQKTTIEVSARLSNDVALFERLLGVGFFHYGPRLWMIGEVEPLKRLQDASTQPTEIDRIVNEYPVREVGGNLPFYRVRKFASPPDEPLQYDSPPDAHCGNGRLDDARFPVLYASPDLEVCVHECRFTAEDELYVATMNAASALRLLDLSVLLREENVTEFTSLDMAVHMLFLAGKHSYPISRAIAVAAKATGLDGIIYPSYFSLLRQGIMPFQTAYGISHRRFPQLQAYEEAATIPNLAIFGRPVMEGKVRVSCINKMIIRRVGYEFHFGPVAC